jgi:hypothetical protein
MQKDVLGFVAGKIMFWVIGKNISDIYKDGKIIFCDLSEPPFRTPANMRVYSNKFGISMSTIVKQSNEMVILTIEIPFRNIVPASKIEEHIIKKWKFRRDNSFLYGDAYRYFGFLFEPKDGWEKIPVFFEYENKKLNAAALRNNDEYATALKNSILGPYIYFGINCLDKKAYQNLLNTVKTLKFGADAIPTEGCIKTTSVPR